ncbi:MAG: HDOD domain-containing protein [Proteobacteria bacterium]|nr:HDOD domain-containing protein [Pseudomonadota bacterium]
MNHRASSPGSDRVRPRPTPADRLAELVEQKAWSLPLLPDAILRVINATSDPGCGARELTEVIRRDASLTGHLFRVASSPHYAGQVKLVSLQQAVARLGVATIREIALVVSCQGRVFSVPGHERAVKEMFRHSLATAIVAQEIARTRRWNVEEAFLSGLLHDVGSAVILQALVDIHVELEVPLSPEGLATATAANHAFVGGCLVEQWQLGPALVGAIRHHHDPAPPPTLGRPVALLQFADAVAHLLLDESDDRPVRTHAALTTLNLYPDDVDRLLARRVEIVTAVEAIA